ncbi:unnamed protein product [Periconia digitata]|uniref:Peptidase A1 domain-containing protein n=1 Tax=Periconia digitata TaxID=1303443 RepID=A0A9W4UNI9_9PLEO|nr:unnamed protein product [Periconia digitata]
MRPLIFILYTASVFLFPATSIAESCAAPPLNIPLRNVSTAPGLLHIGIPIDFGSTRQIVALTPSLQLDNTFIPRYTNTCVHNDVSTGARRATPLVLRRDGYPGRLEELGTTSSNASNTDTTNWWVECADMYGGGYDPSLSQTLHDTRTNNNSDSEPWFATIKHTSWTFVTEQFAFSDYLSVYTATNEALPPKTNTTTSFILSNVNAQFGSLGASLLGLTPSSTLLRSLHADKLIPSTSWSLTNSSLCLGCIDTKSSQGDFHTFKPANRTANPKLPCLLQTTIEALNWHPDPTVEGVSLITSAFTACIDPGVTFLVLPPSVRQSFTKVLGREVAAEYNDETAFKGAPPNASGIGLLTVRVEGGLEVNVSIAGAASKATASTPTAADLDHDSQQRWRIPIGKGAWGAYGEETWVLGKPFTDALVLRWDAETQEFGLANRNPSFSLLPPTSSSSPAEHRDDDDEDTIKPLGCTSFPSIDKLVSTSPSTGIVVGTAIGGLVGGIVFAMAGLFFFRRGVKGARKKYEPLTGGAPTAAADNVSLRTLQSQQHLVEHRHYSAGSWGGGAYGAGPLSPPPPSLRGSFVSGKSVGEVSADDGAIYEAPEGGTGVPTKRGQVELS